VIRSYAEADILPEKNAGKLGPIEAGTVGWEDGKDHFDVASGEVALVKVTLFRGRNPDRDPPLTEGRAGGLRILARISAPMNDIPPDGTEVLVAFPSGIELVPGVAVIFAQPAITPPNQFSKERAKLDFGPDRDLLIKARSITITDYEDRYITIGPTYGIKMGDAESNGAQLKDGVWNFWAADDAESPVSRAFVKLDGRKGEAWFISKDATKGTAGIKFKDGNCTVPCQSFNVPSANGSLGAGATAATGIEYGPTPGVPSTTWYVQA
jgi:hypothetical protein